MTTDRKFVFATDKFFPGKFTGSVKQFCKCIRFKAAEIQIKAFCKTKVDVADSRGIFVTFNICIRCGICF